jgi:hypothetical protein
MKGATKQLGDYFKKMFVVYEMETRKKLEKRLKELEGK